MSADEKTSQQTEQGHESYRGKQRWDGELLYMTYVSPETCVSEDHHGVCEAKTQVQNSSMRDGTCEERREYFVISEHTGGVGERAQLVTCLLCRHQDPSSIPRTHLKMPSACKPSLASFHICVHAYMQKEYIQNLCGMTGGEGS